MLFLASCSGSVWHGLGVAVASQTSAAPRATATSATKTGATADDALRARSAERRQFLYPFFSFNSTHCTDKSMG